MQLRISLVEIRRVKLYAGNPRRNEDAVDKVAASIREFGFRQPIVVDRKMVVIAGHTRLLAARKLGLEEVPVHVAELSPAKARAYRLADNRTHEESDWDEDLLSAELAKLSESHYDLSLTGFDRDELARLLKDVGAEPPEPQIERAAELQKKWATAIGQIWEIPSATLAGNVHELVCGDNRSVPKEFASAELLLTDPPYGIGLTCDWSSFPSGGRKHRRIAGDEKEFDPRPWLHFKKVILWGANHYARSLPAQGRWLVWDKREGCLPDKYFGDVEIAWSNLTGPARMFRLKWSGATRPPGDGFDHPTQKPIQLMGWCIQQAEAQGSIFDPYAGVCTTMIAAEQVRQVCFCVEVDPGYVAVALQRMSDMGLRPRLKSPAGGRRGAR